MVIWLMKRKSFSDINEKEIDGSLVDECYFK